MKRISSIKQIFKSYSSEPFPTKLFISIRYLVCPWDDILKSLEKGESLLDIGCGHGLLLHLAYKEKPSMILTGTDHDDKKIDIAKKSAVVKNMAFLYGSESEKLKDSLFDAVTLIDVLYSIPTENWPQIFSMVKKHLKPDGRLIIKETVTSPKWKYYICLLQEIVAIKILKYTKGDSPTLPPASFYVQMLEKNGFIMAEERRVDYGYIWPHHLFIAGKQA